MADSAARAGDAKKTTPKRRRVKEALAVEVEPDAWERFEKAVGKIAPPRKSTRGASDTVAERPAAGPKRARE